MGSGALSQARGPAMERLPAANSAQDAANGRGDHLDSRPVPFPLTRPLRKRTTAGPPTVRPVSGCRLACYGGKPMYHKWHTTTRRSFVAKMSGEECP
jgi:hypothetical protein